MVKVTKIYLCCDSKKPYKLLWDLQSNTRNIKNKAVQIMWEWNNFSQDYKKQFEEFPKDKDVLNYTLSGFLYSQLKSESFMNSGNLSQTLQLVEKQFKANQKDFLRGEKSIICFKKNQPLDIHNKSIRLSHDNNIFYADISLMNRAAAKEFNEGLTTITFRLMIKDRSTRSIVERCFDNVYSISASKIGYDEKKRMWYLNLSYGFEKQSSESLDKSKILGVYLSPDKPFTASVLGDYDRLSVDTNEIEHYRNAIESRRRSMLKESVVCGDGRIGHGYKKRVEPIEKLSHKVAFTRDTLNHKYSKAIVDYAVRKGCGIIQVENLTGISERNKYLKNWSYYDLQSKIEYKAKEKGIEVVRIDIMHDLATKRCCKCGAINEIEKDFVCTECGFKSDINFNASQNFATKNIADIIGAKIKQT